MNRKNKGGAEELRQAVTRAKAGIAGVAVLSAVLNVLALGGSIYMMLVYDRVLPSRSVPTLLSLLGFVIVVYAFQGFFEVMRSKVLMQIGGVLDASLTRKVHDLIGRIQMTNPAKGDGLQPVRDLDTIRSFISGGGMPALLDLPWLFFFIAILFVFHPLLGATALAGAVILIILTVITDLASREPTTEATVTASSRMSAAESARRHAEVIQALGMRQRTGEMWSQVSNKFIDSQQRLSNIAGSLGSFSRVFRMLLQSLVLSVGAYLVLEGKASAGAIFASSILTARALAPVELAIANWRGFIASRQAWGRLSLLMKHAPKDSDAMALLPPVGNLSVENVTVGPPGAQKLTVFDVSFRVAAGDGLIVIGPSASGKSSLVRALVGAWRPVRGAVRLDGAALDQWASDELGRHIGYLPQNVELLEGTIAENISRFDPQAVPENIIQAAVNAGVHDLILRLPEGYQTQVGQEGTSLSAGQRQRIALARALYLDPFLVVLDEPNSNLDAEGDNALGEAVDGVRARGGIAIIVAHRPSIMRAANLVLFMRNGRLEHFGPKAEVLPKVLDNRAAAPQQPSQIQTGPEAPAES